MSKRKNNTVPGSRVPRSIIATVVAPRIGSDDDPTLVTASLVREGVANTRLRFPGIDDSAMLRTATILREREVPVHDVWTRCFSAAGFRWSVTEPHGLEGFQVAVSSNDATRMHLRVAFQVHDIAEGTGTSRLTNQQVLDTLRADSKLRLNVARHLRPVAVRYMRNAIRASKDIPHSISVHADQIARSLLSLNRIFPYLNVVPRVMPNMDEDSESWHVTVDANFAMTVELSTPSRAEGNTFFGVNVEDNAAFFTVNASVDEEDGMARAALTKAAAVLKRQPEQGFQRAGKVIEATVPARRRKRQKEVTDKGPPPALRREVITVGDDPSNADAPSAVDIAIDEKGHPHMTKVASLQSDVRSAEKWWAKNSQLIKPGIPEIATAMINDHEDNPRRRDANLLVDMAMPRLGEIAKKRSVQFSTKFGVDAAVAGLARLLASELSKRLH